MLLKHVTPAVVTVQGRDASSDTAHSISITAVAAAHQAALQQVSAQQVMCLLFTPALWFTVNWILKVLYQSLWLINLSILYKM